MSKKPLGTSSIFVILGLLFIALTGIRTISTPEIWSHLALGRDSAALSFLETGNPINTSYLYDKLIYTLWNIGKAPLLVVFNTVCLVASFVLLLKVASKWGGALSQGFALLIAGHLIFQSVDVGPQTMMMLFIALFIYLLATIKKPAVLFGTLIVLQILWTNMHATFLFGPLIVGLAAIQAMQDEKVASRKNKVALPSGLLFGLSAALLAATLVNPYMLKLHGQVFANIRLSAPVYWSSLFLDYFQIPPRKPLIFFVLILGAGGLVTLKRRLPIVLTTLAIIGAFLAWSSPKTMMLFAILSFPFVVLSLTAISEYCHGSLDSVLGEKSKALAPATALVYLVLIAFSILPILGNKAYAKTGSASSFGLGVEEQLYPNDVDAIINHTAFPDKVINLPADGGYLAWKYPGRKVFVDYRSGIYDEGVLSQLESMMLGDTEAYDSIYGTYRPEAFIINTLHPAAAQGIVTLLRKRVWKLAYFDGTTAILLLNKPEFAPLLSDTSIQAAGLAKLEKAREAYASKVGGMITPGNPAELIGSGKIFLAFNRPKEAKAVFALILQGNDSIPGAWLGLGNSQLMLKEFDASAASLSKATKLVPNSLSAWIGYAKACRYAGDKDEAQRAEAKATELANQIKSNTAKKSQEKEESVTSEKKTSLKDLTVPE